MKSEMKEATKENQLLKQILSEYENKYNQFMVEPYIEYSIF